MKFNYNESINFLLEKFYNKKIIISNNNYINNLIKIQEYAKNLYIKNLKNNKYIKKILIKRGFNNYIINKYSIGYSNIYSELVNIIKTKKKKNFYRFWFILY